MKGLPLSLAGNTNYIPNKMRLVFGFFLGSGPKKGIANIIYK